MKRYDKVKLIDETLADIFKIEIGCIGVITDTDEDGWYIVLFPNGYYYYVEDKHIDKFNGRYKDDILMKCDGRYASLCKRHIVDQIFKLRSIEAIA